MDLPKGSQLMATSVLIIDDEPRLARNMKTYLQRCGFNVRKAASAAQGIVEFRRFSPDIVLLDFMLPDRDGLKVLRELRALRDDVTVIVISGVSDRNIGPKAIKAGAYDFVPKPLILKDLKSLLERAAEKSRLH
jgi:DNA-binding response OmpR family regulator